MTKGHNQGIIDDKRSQFGFMNGIMNYKKGHDNVEDIFAHTPEGSVADRGGGGGPGPVKIGHKKDGR